MNLLNLQKSKIYFGGENMNKNKKQADLEKKEKGLGNITYPDIPPRQDKPSSSDLNSQPTKGKDEQSSSESNTQPTKTNDG